MNADRPLHMARRMIFIPYSLPHGAEARGYVPWLREVDNPFFNAVPGIHHYANWRRIGMVSGGAPAWDWFDFKGIADDADLKAVWFDPSLDDFRRKWLDLWGYGNGLRQSFLDYSYLFELTGKTSAQEQAEAAVSFGDGQPPAGGDLVYQRRGYLPKHFCRDAKDSDAHRDWVLDLVQPDPLGFDWISVSFSNLPASHALWVMQASQVAAPQPG